MNLKVNFGEINEGLIEKVTSRAYRQGFNDGAGVEDFLPGFFDGSIKEIVIPEGVKKLAWYAFSYRRQLEKVTLPQSLREIGQFAFDNCYALKDIEFPARIERIENSAFMLCSSFEKVIIPKWVYYIGNSAFRQCSNLKEVTFNGTASDFKYFTMGENVFYSCAALKNINVPWSEGEVEGAPWGAPDTAVINYNYVPEQEV